MQDDKFSVSSTYKGIFFILGPQGSGKDTQANLLSEKLGIPTFSAGGLLRERAKQSDELGKKISKMLLTGNLLPTKLIFGLIKERSEKPECKNGFILNGYPRNKEQEEIIEGKIRPDFVIFIEIPDEISIKRISSRMICPKCGRVYIVKDTEKTPVCEVCHVPLVRREDDKPEIIKRRLSVYHKETEPLKEIYKKRGVLVEIDGTPSIEKVFNSILLKIRYKE